MSSAIVKLPVILWTARGTKGTLLVCRALRGLLKQCGGYVRTVYGYRYVWQWDYIV